jgi:hypothetical protein
VGLVASAVANSPMLLTIWGIAPWICARSCSAVIGSVTTGLPFPHDPTPVACTKARPLLVFCRYMRRLIFWKGPDLDGEKSQRNCGYAGTLIACVGDSLQAEVFGDDSQNREGD